MLEQTDHARLDEFQSAKRVNHHLEVAEGGEQLKLAADGKTVLIPQPTNVIWDPLNWPQRKKYAIIAVLSIGCGLMDFGSAAGAVSLIPQAQYWRIPNTRVNQSLSGNVLSIGGGSVLFCLLGKVYGTLPVSFYCLTLTTIFVVLCASGAQFETFFAARILSGLFSSGPVAVSLYVIRDIFFFHEQAKVITWWASSFLVGPYLAPIITSLIFSANPADFSLWRWAFGTLAIANGLTLIALLLFNDESCFNRSVPESEHKRPPNRIARLTAIGRPNDGSRPTLLQGTLDMLKVFFKVPMLLCNIHMMFLYGVIIGINSEIPQFLAKPTFIGGYSFGYKGIAAFYCAPVVGTIIGELTSRMLSDLSFKLHIKRNNGLFHAESRLSLVIFSIPLQTASLVILGYSLQNHWHYMWPAAAWCSYTIAANWIFIGLTEYVFDVYPHAPAEVAGFLGLTRTIGGFVISYYQIEWADKRGAAESFSTQAGILGFGSVLIIFLYFFGQRFRNTEGDVAVRKLDHTVAEGSPLGTSDDIKLSDSADINRINEIHY